MNQCFKVIILEKINIGNNQWSLFVSFEWKTIEVEYKNKSKYWSQKLIFVKLKWEKTSKPKHDVSWDFSVCFLKSSCIIYVPEHVIYPWHCNCARLNLIKNMGLKMRISTSHWTETPQYSTDRKLDL